jgi:hypothetical protein
MNPLKISLICLLIGNISLAANADVKHKQPKNRLVKGNCGKNSCDAVIQNLRSRYPSYIQQFERECPQPRILGLETGIGERNTQQAWFNCWEPKKEKGTRYGMYLGTLPLLGSETKFSIPLPPESLYTSELKRRYPNEIDKAAFRCATKSGNFNILKNKEKDSLAERLHQRVELQCYYQGGVQTLDENGDFKSDGEVSRGAGVDEILGVFKIDKLQP